MKHSKMKKAMGLKGFMSSMSKPKMEMGGAPMTEKQKSFAKLAPPMDKITFADKIAGATKKSTMKKGGMTNKQISKENFERAKPSIPNSYYAMGGMKEENPLASMIKKKAMKKSPMKPGMKPAMKPGMKSGMKPKMAMGGMPPNAFGLGVQPLLKTTDKNQSLKKGGMIKKKKK